jgi:uncharacterized protein GlcG (DUF336 family)
MFPERSINMNHSIRKTFSTVIVVTVLCLIQVGCKSTGQAAKRPPELTDNDVKTILDHAEAAANAQKSLVRVNASGEKQTTRMHIIVMNRNASAVGRRSMEDAWHGSLSIASAKAFTALSFSSDQNALTSRTIGALSQPGGPLWHIGNSNRGMFQPGIIEFPGGVPLYKEGQLVGGIGVSGDGVDEDEQVALAGAKGFEPPGALRIDKVSGGKVPYVK